MSPESTIQLAQQAFDSFSQQDYKASLQNLNKIKQMKFSSTEKQERLSFRIQHNIFLCEYLSNRAGYQTNFVQKVDELIQELQNRQSFTENEKQQQIDDESMAVPEKDDDSLLVYNFCVVLYFIGKTEKVYQILKEQFTKIYTINDLIQLRILLFLIDLSIQMGEYETCANVLQMIENEKSYIQSLFCQNQFQTEVTDENAKNVPKIENKNFFSSILFGSDIQNPEDPISLVNRHEFIFLINTYKVLLLVKLNECQIARQTLKQSKAILNMLLQTLSLNINDKHFVKQNLQGNQNNISPYFTYSQTISLYLVKILNYLFKYTKSYINFKEKNYKKSILILSPQYNQKLSIVAKDSTNINCLLQLYQLNNIACCHINMGKPKMALYYLNKALNYSAKQTTGQQFSRQDNLTLLNVNQKMPIIIYNMATAFYQSKQYLKAAETLQQIPDTFTSNPIQWYRIGVSLVYKFLIFQNDQSNNIKNDLFKEILDYPKNQYLNDQESKNSHKILFKRYVLNQYRQKIAQSDEEKQTKENEIFNEEFKILDAAIKCLRNCLLRINKSGHNNEVSKSLTVQIQLDDEESKINEDKKHQDLKRVHQVVINHSQTQQIHQSTLTYLAYCYLSMGQTNQCIVTCQDALNLSYISEENKFKCQIYLTEAYDDLNKHDESNHIFNQINGNSVNVQIDGKGVLTGCQTQGYSPKTLIQINMTAHYLKINNFTAARQSINNAIASIEIKNKLPIPLINLMLYLNLKQNNKQQALQLLKHRRPINQSSNNNKPLLRLYK